jgi:GNAT superfamily N-acetyltransferase
MAIAIQPADASDAPVVAALVGELLSEIMAATGAADFNFDWPQATARAEAFLRQGLIFALIAWENGEALGLACLYEGHALYTEGRFGVLSELYVRPQQRSRGIGAALLAEARTFGAGKAWTRLETTTPPLPLFEKTLAFYQHEGFAITGGRKLKLLL